jgi:hypothetical protein
LSSAHHDSSPRRWFLEPQRHCPMVRAESASRIAAPAIQPSLLPACGRSVGANLPVRFAFIAASVYTPLSSPLRRFSFQAPERFCNRQAARRKLNVEHRAPDQRAKFFRRLCMTTSNNFLRQPRHRPADLQCILNLRFPSTSRLHSANRTPTLPASPDLLTPAPFLITRRSPVRKALLDNPGG